MTSPLKRTVREPLLRSTLHGVVFDVFGFGLLQCKNIRLAEVAMSRALIAVGVLLIALPGEVFAQGREKGIRLWNLTTATISGFELSPAGKNAWGPNQTLNDRDKEVDHDERLRITGVEPGRYDAKVSYRDARQCFVRDIEIKAEAVFSIADKDLRDCNK
jgi:hypothetical protein